MSAESGWQTHLEAVRGSASVAFEAAAAAATAVGRAELAAELAGIYDDQAAAVAALGAEGEGGQAANRRVAAALRGCANVARRRGVGG